MFECRIVTGCGLVAASSCTFSATAALIRLSSNLPLLARIQGRFFVSWLLAVFALKSFSGRCSVRTLELRGPKCTRRLLALRGVMYWGQVAMWWVAVQNLPLGDLTTAAQVAPLVTSVLAWKFMGEPLSRFFCFVVFIAIIGISCLAIAQHRESVDADFGHAQFTSGVAFIVAFIAMSILPLLVRASFSAHWLEIEHVSAAVAALFLTPLACAGYALSDPQSFSILFISLQDYDLALDVIVLGIASFAALCMQTLGFQLAEASVASFMWYVQVPFSYILQWCLFKERPSLLAIIGATCLVFAAILNLIGARSAVVCEPLIEDDSQAELSGPSCDQRSF